MIFRDHSIKADTDIDNDTTLCMVDMKSKKLITNHF